MTDKVTIVFGVYNHEKFVIQSLRSVLNQDYSPLTILVYDDCSVDRSFDLVCDAVKNYGGPHDIILHRNERNLLNDGIYWNVVPSDYWIHAHADDVFERDRVSVVMETFARTGVAVLSSNAVIIDEGGAPKGLRTPSDEPIDVSLDTFVKEGSIATCFGAGLAFHRDVYECFGPKPAYLLNSDQILPFRGCLLRGAAYVRRPLLKWRWHSSNMTYRVRIQSADDVAEQVKLEYHRLRSRVANTLAQIEALDEFHPKDGHDPQNVVSRRGILRCYLLENHVRATKALIEFEDRIRRARRGEPGVT